ncbi:hypothetical protein D3C71_1949160 [compost metagenome]
MNTPSRIERRWQMPDVLSIQEILVLNSMMLQARRFGFKYVMGLKKAKASFSYQGR